MAVHGGATDSEHAPGTIFFTTAGVYEWRGQGQEDYGTENRKMKWPVSKGGTLVYAEVINQPCYNQQHK